MMSSSMSVEVTDADEVTDAESNVIWKAVKDAASVTSTDIDDDIIGIYVCEGIISNQKF